MLDIPMINLFQHSDKVIFAKRDVEAPCESVDWSGGLTIEACVLDGHKWDDNILYVYVGVNPNPAGDYLLDDDDIKLGILTAREIVVALHFNS